MVIRVAANDPDDVEGHDLKYSIMGTTVNSLFEINENTGWVKVTGELDRETQGVNN